MATINKHRSMGGQDRSRISIKRVGELVHKEPDAIVLELLDRKFGFDEYMNADSMSDKLIGLFAELIYKAFQCNALKGQISKITIQLIDSNYLNKLLYKLIDHRNNFGLYDQSLIKTTIDICAYILEANPSAWSNLVALIERLEVIVKLRMADKTLEDYFQMRITSLKENEKQRELVKVKNDADEYFEPSNDISDEDIIPTLNDLLTGKKPFLRKNIIKGPFKSVNHYIDIHYRLLREDFLQPLRQGITEFQLIINDHQKKNPKTNAKNAIDSKEVLKKLSNIESLYVYTNVKIVSNILMDSGVTYSLQLDNTKHKAVDWEFSKRLLYGSLICLSNDFFTNNLIIAVICDRDIERLKRGIISIKIENNGGAIETANDLSITGNYTMLETSAYFEAYRHVLYALRELYNKEHEFPFKQHIIESKNENMTAPEYILNGYIDFRPLLKNRQTSTAAIEGTNDYFDPVTEFARACYISHENRWPSPNQFGFDQSQYDAIKLALNKQIALIQGPPGTGKTFIGVKLVQLLLHNKNLWWNNNGTSRNRPILMICYTNHALDQFLELCVKECRIKDGVVRIGGRCKTPSLEGFLMRKIKEKIREERRTDASIFYQLKEYQKEFHLVKDVLNLEIACLKLPEEGILKLDALAKVIDSRYFEQIQAGDGLLNWLGFQLSTNDMDKINGYFKKKEPVQSSKPPANDVNNNQVDGDDDAIDDDEDEEFEERLLDEDLVERDIQHQKSKKKGSNNKKAEANFLDTDILPDKSSMIFTQSEIIKYADTSSTQLKDGWQVAGAKNKQTNSVKQYFQRITQDDGESRDIQTSSVWTLAYTDRVKLYKHWVNLYKNGFKVKIDQLQRQCSEAYASVKELRMQEDRIIMQNSVIVAMTTTGAARYHKILKDIGPKIIIVEEAAEVFESHIVTALSKHCQHLILIGDHVQLRPKPNVYKLEKDYRLDVSLFERLLLNNVEHVMLTCQHRMRPEISRLMAHFYGTKIEDHASVHNRPNILGIRHNVFFISHCFTEDTIEQSHSKTNKHEAAYLIELCRFLIKQHYSPFQITILTTYLGQMFLIKNELKNAKLKNVHVCTVDNYQGEENDIILLSLVRSNTNDKIGFLAIENRICVALSRARMGLYCIGNFNLLKNTSGKYHTKWADIVDDLGRYGCIGTGLTLTCRQHPKNDAVAITPGDFKQRPEGGCKDVCNYRLDCGHVCPLFCHLYDAEHDLVKCTKQCLKSMPCGHLCRKKCSHNDKCGFSDCRENVKKSLTCGHVQDVECSKPIALVDCKSVCNKILACGHVCKKKCFESCEPCVARVGYTTPCKHTKPVETLCYLNEWNLQELCDEQCGAELSCGHLCASKCGECFGGRIHGACTQKCDRPLVCGHICNAKCPRECPQCTSACENRCAHSKCSKKCFAPCIPCREPCTYKCDHKKCTRLCHETCNRDGCEYPCTKKLKCGHDCIGFCGEICPPLCRVCDRATVTDIFFGTEDEEDARFVYLEDCRHIIESTGLEEWMKSNYESNEAIKLPDCPRCKTPIRLNLRYSKYVKQQLKAIEQVKLKHNGTEDEVIVEKAAFLQALNSSALADATIRSIKAEYDSCKSLAKSDYINFNNKIRLCNELINFEKQKMQNIRDKQNKSCLTYEIEKIKRVLSESRVFWLDGKYKQRLSSDRQNQIANEIKRVHALYNYFSLKEQAKTRHFTTEVKISVYETLGYLYDLLISKLYSYGEIEKSVSETFEKLKKNFGGLAISEMERDVIVKAMGLAKGHWFKCKNGHIYCITECGGAMEESICPECGVAIGGTSHRLRDDNQLAPEMDNARYPHYSDQANIDNYNFDI